MSHLLKRNEGLTEGLQRVSQELLSDLLPAIGREKLTPGQVHDARKIIKNLRAMLRLTRGALSDEARRAGNQALRKLAGPLSGPRDAVVTLLHWRLLKMFTMKAWMAIPVQKLSRAGRHNCTNP